MLLLLYFTEVFMLRLKLIACKALFRECSYLAAQSKNFVDATYLRQGLHDTPNLLHEALQRQIGAIDSGEDMYTAKPQPGRDFDAILLAYGLCGSAIVGLRSQKYKLVIPRCDDCIALILGSYPQYRDYFDQHPGTYWYTASWIENAYTPSPENDAALYADYQKRFGDDNAHYLMATEHPAKNYDRCAYVHWKELRQPRYVDYAKNAADYFGWDFEALPGDKMFLSDLTEGLWDEERFLIVPIGHTVVRDYEGRLIAAE
jgi:hypothetical protein